MYDTNVNNTGGDAEVMKELLIEMAEEFEKDYPNFKPISSVIHMDEQTPHWHITFVPVATGYKTGMSERCSFTKACANMGLDKYETVNAEGQKVEHYNYEAFLTSLYEKQENKLESRGYKRDFKNNKEKHLSVNEFKSRRDIDVYFEQQQDEHDEMMVERENVAKRKANEREKKLDEREEKLKADTETAKTRALQEIKSGMAFKQNAESFLETLMEEAKERKDRASAKWIQDKAAELNAIKPPIDRNAEVKRLNSTINYGEYTAGRNAPDMPGM